MQVKTFQAKTIEQALHLVREELGPNAAVLSTRHVRSKGIWAWLQGSTHIELTASLDVPVQRRFLEATCAVADSTSTGLAKTEVVSLTEDEKPPVFGGLADLGARLASRRGRNALSSTQVQTDSQSLQFRDDLHKQLTSLQALVEGLYRRSHFQGVQELPEPLLQLYARLLALDFKEDAARELIESLRATLNPEDIAAETGQLMNRLMDTILSCCNFAVPEQEMIADRPRTMAFVGATGVGKTTAVLKLLTRLQKQSVKGCIGIVTLGRHQSVIAEQLIAAKHSTFACEIKTVQAATAAEVEVALQQIGDADLILFDTPGCSPACRSELQELSSMLGQIQPDEVHLVLSSTGCATSLSESVRQFDRLGLTSLIFTKLDEAVGLGNLFSVLRGSDVPLSYMTEGRDVLDAILIAEPRDVASRLLRLV